MEKIEYKCKSCGRCCSSLNIPITIYDIYRMAENINEPDEVVFKKYISKKTLRENSVFAIKKKEDNFCIFLDENSKCKIHKFKPRICSFLPCPDIKKEDEELWRKLYIESSTFEIFWEHCQSENFTKIYIQKYGTEWNESGYNEIILNLQKCIKTSPQQSLRVAKDKNGSPLLMIFDCSNCLSYNICKAETELTLVDIKNIAEHLGWTLKKIFNEIISEKPTTVSGLLKMKYKERKCIFHKPEGGGCSILEIRPKYCEFSPCRLKISDPDTWKRFFFSAGEKDEQWKYHVAVIFTKEYVSKYGTKYKKKKINKYLKKIEKFYNNKNRREIIYNEIDQYRWDIIPIRPK